MVPVWVWNPAPTVFHRSFPHQDDVEAKKRMFTHTYTQAHTHRPGISHEVGDTSSTIARMYHHMVSMRSSCKKVDGKFHHPENYCGHMRCEHEFLTELQKNQGTQ